MGKQVIVRKSASFYGPSYQQMVIDLIITAVQRASLPVQHKRRMCLPESFCKFHLLFFIFSVTGWQGTGNSFLWDSPSFVEVLQSSVCLCWSIRSTYSLNKLWPWLPWTPNVAFLPCYLEKNKPCKKTISLGKEPCFLHFTAEADAKMLLLFLFSWSFHVLRSAAADVCRTSLAPRPHRIPQVFVFFSLRTFTFDFAYACL